MRAGSAILVAVRTLPTPFPSLDPLFAMAERQAFPDATICAVALNDTREAWISRARVVLVYSTMSREHPRFTSILLRRDRKGLFDAKPSAARCQFLSAAGAVGTFALSLPRPVLSMFTHAALKFWWRAGTLVRSNGCYYDAYGESPLELGGSVRGNVTIQFIDPGYAVGAPQRWGLCAFLQV